MSIRLDLPRGVTDDDLLQLSRRNPGYQFERTAEGSLVVSPTGGLTGHRSGQVFLQLELWNRRARLGLTFDSSTGFNLPDGSCLSPDAAWVRGERWAALTAAERRAHLPLVPDAAFEVRSESDRMGELRAKMRVYAANGCGIAVLIDPDGRAVEVYRPGQETGRYEGTDRVALDPELPGFSLELDPLFADAPA